MQSKILTEKNLKKTCFLQGKILRKAFFLLQEQMKNTNVVLDTELIITSRVNYSLGSGPMSDSGIHSVTPNILWNTYKPPSWRDTNHWDMGMN